jgi:hypothetical protein
MTVNFQELDRVVQATELLPLGGFDMEQVSCGTAGCMIGNYNALVGREPSAFGSQVEVIDGSRIDDWDYFGITNAEYGWLFNDAAIIVSNKSGNYTYWHSPVRTLANVTREQAIARLRKFIAYKRRKHELIHDVKYGVSDGARRAEGNYNFVMLAKADVLALAN